MILTSIVLLAFRAGYALPEYHTPTSNAACHVLAVNDPKAQPLLRTLFGVAWNCVLTVFICAWTSVHPNVPPRNRTGGLLARVKLMFWTIVAPELVLAWAVRQWFAAREIRNIYNQHRGNRPSKLWTMAHGHFLEMGGFMLVTDKIDRLEEPEQPGWMSTTADWDPYTEYIRQKERCQLGTLTFERFKKLVRDPNVTFPAITPAQISDRSKGDGLSKLLAILQTSWFILQCVARGYQGLALTELELVTLAMASLNAITYAFWWSKPLSVQEPVNVYVTEQPGLAEEKVNRNSNNVLERLEIYTARDVIDNTVDQLNRTVWILGFSSPPNQRPRIGGILNHLKMFFSLVPLALLCPMTSPFFLFFALGILFLLWLIETEKVENTLADETVATRVVMTIRKTRYKLTHSLRRYFGGPDGPLKDIPIFTTFFFINWYLLVPASFFFLLLLLLLLSPLFAFFSGASFIFTAAFEIVTTNKVPPGATHVPAFYAPRTKTDKYSRMIVFAIFGVIFGSVHCIAWNFSFPTDPERSLWRYTSLTLTTIPLVVAPIDCVLENVNLNGAFGKRLRLMLAIFMTILLFVYVPARLCLIAQALALLRDQPASAYVAVDWTKYIPHLFN